MQHDITALLEILHNVDGILGNLNMPREHHETVAKGLRCVIDGIHALEVYQKDDVELRALVRSLQAQLVEQAVNGPTPETIRLELS